MDQIVKQCDEANFVVKQMTKEDGELNIKTVKNRIEFLNSTISNQLEQERNYLATLHSDIHDIEKANEIRHGNILLQMDVIKDEASAA